MSSLTDEERRLGQCSGVTPERWKEAVTLVLVRKRLAALVQARDAWQARHFVAHPWRSSIVNGCALGVIGGCLSLAWQGTAGAVWFGSVMGVFFTLMHRFSTGPRAVRRQTPRLPADDGFAPLS